MKYRAMPIFVMIFLFVFLAESAWSKGPVQFCASFEDESHYRLLLLDEQQPLSDLKPQPGKQAIPDSIDCEHHFWAHSLWPSFEGDKRSNFKRFNYDVGNPRDIDKQCRTNALSAKDFLKKFAVPKLEWNYASIDASLYERDSAEKFLKRFYNKVFTGYWMADLVCVCPHFEASHQSRTIKAKLIGKCKPDFKKEKRIIPESYELQIKFDDDEDNKIIPKLKNPNWIPCYRDDWKGGCEIRNYASKNTIPVHGQTSGIDESLECYHVDGKFYLNFATNLPKISYGTSLDYQPCYTDSTRCKYGDYSAPQLKTPFYSCEKFNLKEGGCETVSHGLDFIVAEDLKFHGWNREGYFYFFRQKTENELDDFLGNIFYNRKPFKEYYSDILPEGISDKDISRMGDEAVRVTPGMFFYDGLSKVGYEKFEKPMFKNLKEALQHCKEHRF